MRRELQYTPRFMKMGKRVAKKYPQLKEDVRATLNLLEEDAHHPKLKTHKLKGQLKEYWASSVAYDLRIVFQIKIEDDQEIILLHSIGTHDDVY